jgi:hypothetical protein
MTMCKTGPKDGDKQANPSVRFYIVRRPSRRSAAMAQAIDSIQAVVRCRFAILAEANSNSSDVACGF